MTEEKYWVGSVVELRKSKKKGVVVGTSNLDSYKLMVAYNRDLKKMDKFFPEELSRLNPPYGDTDVEKRHYGFDMLQQRKEEEDPLSFSILLILYEIVAPIVMLLVLIALFVKLVCFN